MLTFNYLINIKFDNFIIKYYKKNKIFPPIKVRTHS